MANKDRSVIERLEDIENKLPSYEYQEPRPISEAIGRPFADYLKDATLYGYEEDERLFKSRIQKQKILPIIAIAFISTVLALDIVFLIVNKQSEWLLILACIVSLFCPVVYLLSLINQKTKQPMKSFWNMRNAELYIANKRGTKELVKEEKAGALFYILLIGKIISIFASFAFVLWYGLSSSKETLSTALYWIGVLFGYLVFGSNSFSNLFIKQYRFSNYLIETDDSYVTFPHLDYFRK